MGGLFRKKASETEERLRRKRVTFFARQRNQEDSSGGHRAEGSQGASEPAGEMKAAQADANVRSQEKEAYMIRCPRCGKMVNRDRVARRKYICYECEGYFRVRTNNRIRMVADPHTFQPWFTDMPVRNPLSYEGYEEKLREAREKTGLEEAFTVGQCKVFGQDIVLGICDSRFLMASMGHVVGDRKSVV